MKKLLLLGFILISVSTTFAAPEIVSKSHPLDDVSIGVLSNDSVMKVLPDLEKAVYKEEEKKQLREALINE